MNELIKREPVCKYARIHSFGALLLPCGFHKHGTRGEFTFNAFAKVGQRTATFYNTDSTRLGLAIVRTHLKRKLSGDPCLPYGAGLSLGWAFPPTLRANVETILQLVLQLCGH